MPTNSAYLTETLLTLAAVSVAALVILYGARRFGVARARGPIELCGQLALDARRAIYLVKIGDQVLVVGVGDGGFTKLGEMALRDLPSLEQPPGAFSAILRRLRTDGVAAGDPPEGRG